MAEDHCQLAIGISQRQAQPGMHAVFLFDHTADRPPAFERDGEAKRKGLTMGANDFRNTATTRLHAEYVSQARPGDAEPAITGLIELDDGNAGQHAAQCAGINFVTRNAARTIAQPLPVIEQFLLGNCDALE